ncbi:MAG: GNAT family N-acetyltransferase [archaeon]|jgi:ribosomal protein S18 acetylase RimI-like enzyme|nr:GNAT family N-acetyltransferase [Candidatus Bathyarchaeum sp.]
MAVELKFGVPENQKVQLASIAYDAFESKFNKFYGNKNKVIDFMSKNLRNDRTIRAQKNGKTVGFAGLEYKNKGFIDPDFTKTFHVFGVLSPVAFFITKLFVLANQTKPKELHLESIAVSKNERGKGIGSKLLQFVLNYARSKGFSRIVLEVVDHNRRAKKLYESFGFEQVSVNKIPYPMSFLVGFGSIIQMDCKL